MLYLPIYSYNTINISDKLYTIILSIESTLSTALLNVSILLSPLFLPISFLMYSVVVLIVVSTVPLTLLLSAVVLSPLFVIELSPLEVLFVSVSFVDRLWTAPDRYVSFVIPVSAPCGVSCEVCHASVDPFPVLLPVLLFVPLEVDSLVFVLDAWVFVSETTAFVRV